MTPKTPTHREKFQGLLRKLFQFDCADLDFGIYRIMNHKRQAVEEFIEKDLLDAVAVELRRGILAMDAGLAAHLAELRAKIIDTLGEEALDAEDHLDPQWHASKLGKEYLDLHRRARHVPSGPEVEAEIFNHLYTFFSRYFDAGDFMSLRRYSRRDKYAIPYNGEEVHLHWANNDQYYIKTGENFTDYAYKHGTWTVRFALRNADVEQNNVKGVKRFFLPQTDQLDVDDKCQSITLPVHYRPLNDVEEALYGKKKTPNGENNDEDTHGNGKTNGRNGGDNILTAAVAAIEKATAKAPEGARSALSAEKRRAADGRPVPLIEHHLRFYTAKNTTDFFIHKDLGGFLTRELDFYIKNDVLNVDEIGEAGPTRAESWFQIMRCLKAIGRRIIAFLAQIENFQKRLYEKKKFVTAVNWCVTLDRVPETLYQEIIANKEQIQEWRELFHIHEIEGDLASPGYSVPLKTEFLKSQRSLVLDTRFFSQEFTDTLLASNEFLGRANTIEEATDGVLVESDNYQALNLLRTRFDHAIKCCYIDPPYNRGANDFNYKDAYRHSSWLTMIVNRLEAAKMLLRQDGVIFTSIDENERTSLDYALKRVFGADNRVEELIWAQNTTHSQSPTYSTNHEYVPVFAQDKPSAMADPTMFREPKPGFAEIMELVQRINPGYPTEDEIAKSLKELMDTHLLEFKNELAELGLPYNEETKKQDPWKGIYNYDRGEYRDENGSRVPFKAAKKAKASIWVWREDNPSAPAGKQSDTTRDPSHPNYRFYEPEHPITKQKCPHPKTGWRWPYEWDDTGRASFKWHEENHRIVWGPDNTKVPQFKRFLHEVETNVAKSVIHDYTDGEKQLTTLFGESNRFPTPKPTTLIERFVLQTTRNGEWVMDFFGGSGTTGQAVMDAAVATKQRLHFLLVEMGAHFGHTLLKRMKKLCYTPHWDMGKPSSPATAEDLLYRARVLKYIHLESYEDALDNIGFTDPQAPQSLLTFEDYTLGYMLDFETKDSATFLNVASLDEPFDYKLKLHGRDKPQAVDLPETFNYLLGLHVASRRVSHRGKVRYVVYSGMVEGRGTVVIWRTTRGWKQADWEVEREWVAKEKLTATAEDVWVNSDSFIDGARSLDPVFKKRMFNED